MIGLVLGFALGILSSIVANLLWEAHGLRLLRRYQHWIGQRRYKKRPNNGFLKIGTAEIPWLTVAFGPWAPENIHCRYDASSSPLHPSIQDLYAQIQRQADERRAAGLPAPFNGLGYRLESFWVGNRTPGTEDAILELRFRPTDYFAMLASDQSLDKPVVLDGQRTTFRAEFASHVDLSLRPVPELATHWGIALQVITRDGFTLFAERGQTAVDAHVFFPSIAEGASRPMDDDGHGAPDPYRTAIRGAMEELGIEIARQEVRWLSFGANAVLCEYGLIGMAHVPQGIAEIMRARDMGVPKDKWEAARLHAVPWTPEDVAAFVMAHTPWSPFALVTLAHALIHDFSLADVEWAFAGKQITCSQRVPQ